MTQLLVAVALMAIVTCVPGVFPIAIFKHKIKSRFFESIYITFLCGFRSDDFSRDFVFYN